MDLIQLVRTATWMQYLYAVAVLAFVGWLYWLWANRIGRRDWFFAAQGLRLLFDQKYAAIFNELVPNAWNDTVRRVGRDKVAILFGDVNVTYGEMDDRSNQIAWHFGDTCKLQAGDTVALLMNNCPDYMIIWLGLSKIGVRTAFINHNLKAAPLVHALVTSKAQAIIFDADAMATVQGIAEQIPTMHLNMEGERASGNPLQVYSCGTTGATQYTSLDAQLENAPRMAIPAALRARNRGVRLRDPMLYIYTSGTTGMPKAASITHSRYRLAKIYSFGYAITEHDRVYTTLPLYHSSASLIGGHIVILTGGSMVLRKKFSASGFWREASEKQATIVQYIGELARYLLATPETPFDKNHSVRLAVGNGLQHDLWRQFQNRFAIPQIGEFYAATEGPGALFNVGNVFGSAGFVSPFMRFSYNMTLVQFDTQTESVVRTPHGLCIECKPGEIGEFVTEIKTDMFGVTNFTGYTNKEATEKKILRNVFKKGDQYFRSGDLMKRDIDGNMFFVDRIGDTFRWKGENVSTTEVAAVLQEVVPGGEVNVYGVGIPGREGRAGMAAVVPQVASEGPVASSPSLRARPAPLGIDPVKVASHVIANLPVYARPMFIRVVAHMQVTVGTCKMQKTDLVEQGFDPAKVSDAMFFLDGNNYVPLTPAVYENIVTGVTKL